MAIESQLAVALDADSCLQVSLREWPWSPVSDGTKGPSERRESDLRFGQALRRDFFHLTKKS